MSRANASLLALATSATAACTLASLDRYAALTDTPLSDAGGDGAVPAADGAVDAGGDADFGPSWKRYSISLASPAGWTIQDIDQIWSGPNAPPPRGIAGAVELFGFDRLLIFTESGGYHLQSAGVWQPASTVAVAFPEITGGPVDDVWHVPYAFRQASDPDAAPKSELMFVRNPRYWQYDYGPGDLRTFTGSGTLGDDPPPAAPQGSGHLLADWEELDLGNADPAERLRLVSVYADGFVYKFNVGFVWTKTAISQHRLWAGQPGAPALSNIRAGYVDQATQTLHILGP